MRGTVYNVDESILVKDVYGYQSDKDRWRQMSGTNITAAITVLENTIIIKDGKIVPMSSLENGDSLLVMMEESLAFTTQATNTQLSTTGYVIIVE